jgi:hypothetical protein
VNPTKNYNYYAALEGVGYVFFGASVGLVATSFNKFYLPEYSLLAALTAAIISQSAFDVAAMLKPCSPLEKKILESDSKQA